MIIIAKTFLPNKKLYTKNLDKIYVYVWVQVYLVLHFKKSIT